MATDAESPWDDLLSDIRVHQVHFKQGIVACWEGAMADLGLSLSKPPPHHLFGLLTTVARTESEWPDSNDQIDEICQAMDVRTYLLLDEAEDCFDRFKDCLS